MPMPGLRLNSRRYQRVVVACLATLAISGCLIGGLLLTRRQADRAVRGDTRLVAQQAGQQLLRAIQSRRGTLTLLRDTFDKAPALSPTDRSAMARSAVTHTRHLLGIGIIQPDTPVTWWSEPPLDRSVFEHLDRAIQRRTSFNSAWRVPSTFTVALPDDRQLLVMLEPLRNPANHASALVGLFDVRPLLSDFFELTLQQPYPVEVLEANHRLYQSPGWQPPADGAPSALLSRSVSIDALRWTVHMQPGATRVVRTIGSFQGMLELFSVVAGGSSIALIWLLAMRAWLLERTVRRRTAALRRTTERLRQLAITDELTGLYNRRFFQERWHWEVHRSQRYQRPLACLMVDVNDFKRVNDQLGHPVGDQLLRQVAEELRAQLRQSDILARFGGDEFVVALPETSPDQARAVADKLSSLLIHGPWSSHPQVGPVRLSVGLTCVDSETPEEALRRADSDLYARKSAARSGSTASSEPVRT